MQKILATSFALGISLGLPLAAFADSYKTFMKTQVAEFEHSNSGKCKEKTMEGVESGSKMTYELCIYRGSPVYLRTSSDGTPMSVSSFKKGKLVQIMWAEAGSVGFRNGQPVVEWNPGESGERRVNWKLNAEEKSNYRKMAGKNIRILRKFGF